MMLRQEIRQAHGNTVRNDFAHRFSFKADSEVRAENNRSVTELVFDEELAGLATLIEGKFGHVHSNAKRPRLMRKPAAR